MFWFGFADNQQGGARRSNMTTGVAPVQDNVDPDPQEEDESVGDEISTMLMALLPWSASILFHVGLVLLAIFTVWTTVKQLQQEEAIIPIARLSVTPGSPLMRTSTRRLVESSKSRQRQISKNPSQTNSALSSKVSTETNLIGAAGGSAGKGSPFGTAIRSGGGTQATMYGEGGNARRITYLIDASGSLLDSLPFIINELKRSITELTDQQQFTIIFFQGEEAIEVPPIGLKGATAKNKKLVLDWIDIDQGHIRPEGDSNPVSALKLALKYRPQLMFLLSDDITGQAQYEINQQRLLAEIKQANSANTKINTIQFLYPDRLALAGLKPTLQMISEDTGGIYKFVDGRELGIQ